MAHSIRGQSQVDRQGSADLGPSNIPDEISPSRSLNVGAPISTLPVELLQDIFDLVLNEASYRTSTIQLQRSRARVDLMSVCHNWHAIMITTPRFWSIISTFCPHSRTDMEVDFNIDALQRDVAFHLERSKSAPLNVTVAFWDGRSPSVTQLVSLLRPHMHRFTVLSLHGEENFSEGHAAIAQIERMPALEELALAANQPFSEPVDLDFSPHHPGRLRRLELKSTRGSRGSQTLAIPLVPFVSCLRSIRIIETVEAENVLALLSYCADSLTHFTWIREGFTPSSPMFVPSSSDPIVLPALKTLRLVGDEALSASRFFEAPNLTHLVAERRLFEFRPRPSDTDPSVESIVSATIRRWVQPDATRPYIAFPKLEWVSLPIPGDFTAKEVEEFVDVHVALTHLEVSALRNSNAEGIRAFSRRLSPTCTDTSPAPVPVEVYLAINHWVTSVLLESTLAAAIERILETYKAHPAHSMPLRIHVNGWGITVLGDMVSSPLRRLATENKELSLGLQESFHIFPDFESIN